MLGPLFIKLGVKKAGEIGLNITEEDLIETYHVGKVMDKQAPVIPAGASLAEIIKIISDTDNFYYPVVDNGGKLIGAITWSNIRSTFARQELSSWLVALDIMEPVIDKVTPEAALSESLQLAKKLDIDYLPVVASKNNNKFVGILDCRAVHRQLSAEVLARQQKADMAAGG